MEARKFIKEWKEEEEGARYLHKVLEVRDVDIRPSDWDVLYQDIFGDDYENAYYGGLAVNDDDYLWFECDKILQALADWEENLKDDGESLDEYNDDFQEQIERIRKVCQENEGFTVHF